MSNRLPDASRKREGEFNITLELGVRSQVAYGITQTFCKEMKKLTATMFILGIPWLFLVIPLVLSPAGIFIPEYDYRMHDVAASILLSSCGLLGIAIWLGYRLRWKLNNFVWVTKRQFWSLSIFHHVAWIFLLPRVYPSSRDEPLWDLLTDFWLSSGTNVYGIWISLSIFVAVFALIFDRDIPCETKELMAEQGGDGDAEEAV